MGARGCTADGSVVLIYTEGRALLARTDAADPSGAALLLAPGLRPPTKDFDYNQPLIREGPNDHILLRNRRRRYRWSSVRGRRRSGRNAGAAYERKDWLPINELGGTSFLSETYYLDPEGRWVADGGGDAAAAAHAGASSCPARRTCSAFVDKPLCVARQLAELLQLSLKKVCADFDTTATTGGAWVLAKEVRQFCPMRFLSLQGDVVDSYDPAKRHRTVCFLCFNGHCYMYRCVKRVLERDAWRTLYRGEAWQELPPIVEWKRFALPLEAPSQYRHANP